MSFRTDLLQIVDDIRSIPDTQFDIRLSQLTIRTRVWSGEYRGLGTATDTDLVLPKKYPIRHVTAQEVSASGGAYELADIKVDHITPSNGAGVGYTIEQLRPTVVDDVTEVIYLVSGIHEGEYSLKEIRQHKPFSYIMILSKTNKQL